MPDTAKGNADRWASIHGLTRNGPRKMEGTVAFTGTIGAILPAGSVFQRGDGVQYSTLDPLTLEAPLPNTVACKAIVGGAAGNTSDGTAVALIVPVSGINPVGSITTTTLEGADAETDAQLIERVLAHRRNRPQGGADADYAEWAKAIATVDDVWVFPEELGAGSVTVRFSVQGSGADRIPSAAKVAEVQAAVDLVRPVTADVTVFAPVAAAQQLSITVVPFNAGVRDSVNTAVQALLDRVGGPGVTIRNSVLREAISGAAGESYHLLTDVNGDGTGLSDIVLAANEIPTLDPIVYA